MRVLRKTCEDAVYPRVCGGTLHVHVIAPGEDGLSPRVRGNHAATFVTALAPWSIPACAGEPPVLRNAGRPLAVYPRVCGGTASSAMVDRQSPGLSPRVRGNLVG